MEHAEQKTYPVGTKLVTDREPGSRFPVYHGEVTESLWEGVRIQWDGFSYPMYYTWWDFRKAREHGVRVEEANE